MRLEWTTLAMTIDHFGIMQWLMDHASSLIEAIRYSYELL